MATPGETYKVAAYIRNDGVGDHVDAYGTRLRFMVPNLITEGSARIDAVVLSENSTTREIWDSTTFSIPNKEPVGIRIVPDSTKAFVNKEQKDFDLTGIFSEEGSLIGCNQQNGILLGNNECTLLVQFEVFVFQPNFTVTAEARIKDAGYSYSNSIKVSRGDVVELRVEYKNTGNINQDNVIISFPYLPDWMEIVSGTSMIANRKTSGKWKPTEVKVDNQTRINVGSYRPGGNCFFKFNVIIKQDAPISDVPVEIYTFRVDTENGSKKDSIMVLI